MLGCIHERQTLTGLLLMARGSCRPLHSRHHSQHWSTVCGLPSFEPHTSYKHYFVLLWTAGVVSTPACTHSEPERQRPSPKATQLGQCPSLARTLIRQPELDATVSSTFITHLFINLPPLPSPRPGEPGSCCFNFTVTQGRVLKWSLGSEAWVQTQDPPL